MPAAVATVIAPRAAMQRLELAPHRRIVSKIVPARRLRADRARHRIRPGARVESRAAEHEKREPADDQACLWRSSHLERGRFQDTRHDDEEDGEDGEAVVSAEDGTEDRARLAARADGREDRRRRRGAEDDRAAHQDRQCEVIEELERVEVERFHACMMTRRHFRPEWSV